MDKAEWLASDDPASMLRHLTHETRRAGNLLVERLRPQPLVNDRKLRLFACACCRQVWHLLTDPRSRRAVEVAERYADGLASLGELVQTEFAARDAWEDAGRHPFSPEDAVGSCTGKPLGTTHLLAEEYLPLASQAALLRDIAGNPWRPLPQVNGSDPAGMALGNAVANPTVLALATAAYESREGRKCKDTYCVDSVIWSGKPRRKCEACGGTGIIEDGTLDPDRLALLSDALEEAGCPQVEHYQADDGWGIVDRRPHPLLAHLRGPGVHVRGCWVVDLLLGRE